MTKKNSNQASAKDGWCGFLELCTKMRSAEDFGRMFDLFLTIEEKENIASRYLIVAALLEGRLTQREIAETFKVSIAQITRGSNALKVVDAKFRKSIKTKVSRRKNV